MIGFRSSIVIRVRIEVGVFTGPLLVRITSIAFCGNVQPVTWRWLAILVECVGPYETVPVMTLHPYPIRVRVRVRLVFALESELRSRWADCCRTTLLNPA